ncbi:MAG: M14 family metallopeptidase [Mycobacterium leprae]
MPFDPGRFLRYEEMTAQLREWAAAYPALCELAAIAQSAEGRTVWAMTLTNKETGEASAKPGYLVDGNTHAGEMTGGAAALYTIHWLLTNYGQEPTATAILDTRTFYVIPRIAVDGVELYLTTPNTVRSSPKVYPEPTELPGLYPTDLNGDGLILQMRQVHPDGDWKVDAQDPRLMVARLPEDRGSGPYYKLYTEGMLREWDGKAMPVERRMQRLDFNRNYPAFWNPEGKQPGAGPYPLSEPETRAVATFILAHPNIGAYVCYHTSGGVLLRPPSNGGDDKLNGADLAVFKRIGELCTRFSGHPCKSTYESFAFPGQEALVKGADDWAYEHHGVMAFTFELWNSDLHAGGQGYAQIGVKGLMARKSEQVIEHERNKLAWNDRELGGKGFINWTPFEHPQLGPVEIGGWNTKWCIQNAPEGPMLIEEISKAASFTFQNALALPCLTVTVKAAAVGKGLYKVSACIANSGGLPTNITQQAVAMKSVQPIRVEFSGNARILSGKERQEVGHLEGWATSGGRTRAETWVDWLVQAEPDTALVVTASTARAGQAMGGVTLA